MILNDMPELHTFINVPVFQDVWKKNTYTFR